MSELICEGETCEGCRSEHRNTDRCKPPKQWADYVKKWKRKPMSESTDRIVAVRIRTDASGEFCAKDCPEYTHNTGTLFSLPNCRKNGLLQPVGGLDVWSCHMRTCKILRHPDCHAAEIEMDEKIIKKAS